MGFSRTVVDDGHNHPELSVVGDDDGLAAPDISSVDVAHGTPKLLGGVDARNIPASGSRAPVAEFVATTNQTGVGTGQSFWRSLVRSMDGVIKSNSTAQVIPSAEAIAAEVLKQQKLQLLEQHGTRLSIENWTGHTVETDMARDAELTYREIDSGRSREIFCSVCN
jgi:hypothetical protein